MIDTNRIKLSTMSVAAPVDHTSPRQRSNPPINRTFYCFRHRLHGGRKTNQVKTPFKNNHVNRWTTKKCNIYRSI